MIKKIYSYLILFAVLATVACSDDAVGITSFGVKIDLSKSSLSDYQLTTTLIYSTDGGDTFVGFPQLKKGQTFQVKVIYNPDADTYVFPDEGSMGEIKACAYDFDWSASDPQPTSVDANTGMATFVVGNKTGISVAVTDKELPSFSVDDMVGTYEVVVDDWNDFSVGDKLTVEKIDATHIRVVEYPATTFNHAPLVIKVSDLSTGDAVVESQDNGSYNASGTQQETTTGTGSLSSCAGTIDLVLNFTLPCCGSNPGNKLVLQRIE